MAKDQTRVIALIGGFKLMKATLLVALGVSGLVVMPQQLSLRAEHAVAWMGAFPGRHTLDRALTTLLSLDHRTEQRLAVLSLFYAVMFLVEGLGLLRGKRWAEWLTVVVTTSFIPIEIYELVEHIGPGKVVAVILNIAIVIYLVRQMVAGHRASDDRIRHSVRAA